MDLDHEIKLSQVEEIGPPIAAAIGALIS